MVLFPHFPHSRKRHVLNLRGIQVELLGGLVNRPVMSEPAILIMRVTLNLRENSVGL